MTEEEYEDCAAVVNDLSAEAHRIAVDRGWYDGRERGFPEMVALMHSELSEALEAYRDGEPVNRFEILPDEKPQSIGFELADCMIRILDAAEHIGADLGYAITAKMQYNATRPYRHGGKLA